jgi:uncharacterized spore protein YtfJ
MVLELWLKIDTVAVWAMMGGDGTPVEFRPP